MSKTRFVLVIDDRLRSAGGGPVAPLVFLTDLPRPIVHGHHHRQVVTVLTIALAVWRLALEPMVRDPSPLRNDGGVFCFGLKFRRPLRSNPR
jgi:hypothetical protein